MLISQILIMIFSLIHPLLDIYMVSQVILLMVKTIYKILRLVVKLIVVVDCMS
jgi:hypothetical protein